MSTLYKLYLAGPMRGLPEFNAPAFHAAAKQLRANGFEVWSAAEHSDEWTATGLDDPANPDYTPDATSRYMQRDLPQVCKADAVAVLPNWHTSRGARIEVMVARMLKKPVFWAATNTTLTPEELRAGHEI